MTGTDKERNTFFKGFSQWLH